MPKTPLRLPAPQKVPTGINGFDEITGGGLPAGRPTLVCGSAGCGKSLFALEFLIRGALQYGESGVLMTFEKTADDIRKNVKSLGFDTDALISQKKLVIDFVSLFLSCVILLDHRVLGQISTRRLRVVKYRGSTHGTNEYPFLIDEQGISILPITSSGLEYEVSKERISTGVPGLDEMLGGLGYYRGSTVLLTGTAGTGKTSVAAHLAEAACARGERCLFFSFEESPAQILRNMRAIGINLQTYVRKDLLRIHSSRPTVYGLETHLVRMHKLISEFQPKVVVVDPVSNLRNAGTTEDSTHLFVRLVDFLRKNGILGFLVSLTSGGRVIEATDEEISSMVDTWLLLRDVEVDGERNRMLYVLKSRGMKHSNQVREFLITVSGVKLVDAYLGAAGVLTGSARLSQEAREAAESQVAKEEIERKKLALEHRQKAMEAQIAAMRAAFHAEEEEFQRMVAGEKGRLSQLEHNRQAMAQSRRLVARSNVVARPNRNNHQ
jgi:circadian clock protein KaiC